jgi:hypothetical protein
MVRVDEILDVLVHGLFDFPHLVSGALASVMKFDVRLRRAKSGLSASSWQNFIGFWLPHGHGAYRSGVR